MPSRCLHALLICAPISFVRYRERSSPNHPQEVVHAWQEGIDRLLERGVTGRILLANFVFKDLFSVSVLG